MSDHATPREHLRDAQLEAMSLERREGCDAAAVAAVPMTPIERDPIEAYRGRSFAEVESLLDEAVAGMELGAYDLRIIEWIKRWDQPTIITIASTIARARHHDANA